MASGPFSPPLPPFWLLSLPFSSVFIGKSIKVISSFNSSNVVFVLAMLLFQIGVLIAAGLTEITFMLSLFSTLKLLKKIKIILLI